MKTSWGCALTLAGPAGALALAVVALALALVMDGAGDSATEALAKAYLPSGNALGLDAALVFRDAGTFRLPVSSNASEPAGLLLVALDDLAGPDGPQGQAGPTGLQGEAGEPGPKGARGTNGTVGGTGAAGLPGESVTVSLAELVDYTASLPQVDGSYDGNLMLVRDDATEGVAVPVASFRRPGATVVPLSLSTPIGAVEWNLTFYEGPGPSLFMVEFPPLDFGSETPVVNVSLTAQLPVGFRPAEAQDLPVSGRVTLGTGLYKPGKISINPDGELRILFWATQTLNGVRWYSDFNIYMFVQTLVSLAENGVAAPLGVQIPGSFHQVRLA